MDGLYLCRREEREIGLNDLQDVLVKIAQAVYGKDIEEYRFNKDTFPYTDPSLEMEIKVGGRWVEVLGSGVVQSKVLDNLGVDSKLYNGWAFGFGLERLAILSMQLPDIRLLWSEDERVKRQLRLGNVYKEVSKYPPVTRDISFVVSADFAPNDYFDLIRDVGGDLVEEVSLLDKYENEAKFGKGKISYAYRVVYRSNERTLTNTEVDVMHRALEKRTTEEFGATVR
jgi:phenylalanyl-tRNA synthetase alpha chain